ncbi:uncharacterized protein A4U43_C05F13630 [Asparagus officinalis]|uniref:Very-long-chain (3R)-3-hydroxyacyl-CoA dehydratase n=1 Tax=Asparagus officinalis TaxID=4686 RepID=A0A5P1ERD8_ASPOF|nr:uncharacterized protein A4U43_C05F13630 [Asparagus officinalis]
MTGSCEGRQRNSAAKIGERIRKPLYSSIPLYCEAHLPFSVKTLRQSSYREVYNAVEKPLQLAQTAAVMEILHGIVGLVRSPVSATLPRISSRLGGHICWLALWLSAGHLQRYSRFLILYPSGITSEVGMIYIALPYIKASEKYCIRMSNKWNFSFDYFYAAIISLGIYVSVPNVADETSRADSAKAAPDIEMIVDETSGANFDAHAQNITDDSGGSGIKHGNQAISESSSGFPPKIYTSPNREVEKEIPPSIVQIEKKDFVEEDNFSRNKIDFVVDDGRDDAKDNEVPLSVRWRK